MCKRENTECKRIEVNECVRERILISKREKE